MTRCIRCFSLALAIMLVCGNVAATLLGRDLDPTRPGYEAYYDTAQNITWMADADYARTSGYSATGLMTFVEAATWAAQVSYYGISGWRLPVLLSPTPTICLPAYGAAACGYNTPANAAEITYMFERNLGLHGAYDTAGNPRAKPYGANLQSLKGVPGVDPGVVFTNVSAQYWNQALASTEIPCPTGAVCESTPIPGATAMTSGDYWQASDGSGQYFRCLFAAQCADLSEDPLVATAAPIRVGNISGRVVRSWIFGMVDGYLAPIAAANQLSHAWAVRPGDIAPVPEPRAALLILPGLAVLLPLARRKAANTPKPQCRLDQEKENPT